MKPQLADVNVRRLPFLDFLSQFLVYLAHAPAAGCAHKITLVKGKHRDKEKAEAVKFLIRFQRAVPAAAGADQSLSEAQRFVSAVHAENKKHTLPPLLIYL